MPEIIPQIGQAMQQQKPMTPAEQIVMRIFQQIPRDSFYQATPVPLSQQTPSLPQWLNGGNNP